MRFKPMLAESGQLLKPLGEGWLYQLKLDGERAIWDGVEGKLYSRSEQDITRRFPKIVAELKLFPNLVLDGEIVVLKGGVDDFESLQHIAHTEREAKISELNESMNIVYYVFDCLEHNGLYLGNRPLVHRIALLGMCLSHVRTLEFWPDFNSVWSQAREGVMAKRANSIYKQYRSTDWLKIKKWQDAVIEFTGYEEHDNKAGITLTNPLGDRVSVGSTELAEKIKRLMDANVRNNAENESIEVEVQYFGRNDDGKMRFPTFKRLVE